MKKLSVIVSLLLVAILSFGMVGCSSYPSLEKAFEKEGFEVVKEVDEATKTFKEQAEKDEIVLTPHAMISTTALVFILEFNATEDMKKMYENSETVKGAVKDVSSNEDVKEWQKAMEEAGYAKGNCLVFTLSVVPGAVDKVKEIVKNA